MDVEAGTRSTAAAEIITQLNGEIYTVQFLQIKKMNIKNRTTYTVVYCV